jgi:electron transport complex protein RnfD
VYAFLGAVFAMAVVKHGFGGLGANWLNPAAGAWLFVRFSWPWVFSGALEGSPLINGGFFFPDQVSSLDTSLRLFLNNMVFNPVGAVLPAGYIDLFKSSSPGIIADRGVLGLLLGSIFIISTQVNRVWAPLAYLSVFALCTRFFGALSQGYYWQGDVLFGLLTGGTLAAAFILNADPSVSPKSSPGILAVSLVSGFLGALFRWLGSEPYGVFFSAALLNAALPLVRDFENKKLYEKQKNPRREGRG